MLAQADADFKKASSLLLGVLRDAAGKKDDKAQGPARAAIALVSIVSERENELERRKDKAADDEQKHTLETELEQVGREIDALQKLIFEDMKENPPPLATTLLIRRDLRDVSPQTMSGADEQRVRKHCDHLDAIIEKYPDHPETLEARLESARLAYLLGEYDKTQAICDAVLADLPRERRARLYRALVEMQCGKVNEAEKALFALKTDFPHWPAAHYAYAQAAMQAGKKELAREALRYVTEMDRKLLDTHVEFPGAHLLLGESLLEDGFAKEAIAEAQTVLRDYPANPRALSLLVNSAVAAEETDLAREALASARQKFADNPATQAAVAEGYARLGESKQAEEVAKGVLASEPETLRDRLQVAQVLIRLGKVAEAEATLTKAVQANPQSATAQFLLGSLLYETRRSMQASDHLQAAVDLAPENPAYRLALARALLRSNLIEDASGQIEAILARNPSNAEAALLASQVQALRDEDPDLGSLLESGLSDRSGRALALACLVRGEPQKCVELCNNFLQDNPDDVDMLWLLGRAQLLMGDRDACIRQWTKALMAEPTELRFYEQLARLLSQDKELADIENTLAAIPGAQRELVHMASAALLQEQRQYEAAAETYGRVADDPGVEEGLRALARIRKGLALAEAGQADLAILEFDRVPSDSRLYVRARLSKAALLGAANRLDEANTALDALQKAAVADAKWDILQRIGRLHLHLNQPEKALAVVDDAVRLVPSNPEPLLLRASLLSGLGRTEESLACQRKAVGLQPGNLPIHIRLIEGLDEATRRREALDALGELAKQGRTGKTLSLIERGFLFSRWGLQKQALATLTELADSRTVETPRVRLVLGQALAALGQDEKAHAQLSAIPPYAPQYVPARQTLAALADTDEAKLAALRQAEKAKPSPILTAQRIAILLGAHRPRDAVTAFHQYMETLPERAVPSPAAATAGLGALLAAGDESAAASLARHVAVRSRDNRWRRMAALLMIRTKPEDAQSLLPPPEQAGLYDALLGVCLVAGTGGNVTPWAARVTAIHDYGTKQEPPRPVLAPYRLLTALVSGDAKAAEACLPDAKGGALVAPAVMRELVTAAASGAAAKGEADAILASSIAVDLGLAESSRQWAMKVLQRRHASQWAATLAARGLEDVARLRKIADILTPKDCVTARFLEMMILRQEGKFAEAAEAARALADAHPDHPELRMAQATATERAGRLPDALPLYQEVWEKTRNPVAANNAAYLVSVLYPKDRQRLEQALAWTKAAVAAAPGAGAFRDTRGWITYLLGRYDEARQELCRAVKRGPNEPEIHYHLGLAERETGNATFARWHLEAAVDLAQAMESENQELPSGVAEALRLARAALAELEGSEAP